MLKYIPSIEWISPIVSWFLDSASIGNCKIKPGATNLAISDWKVSCYDGSSAHQISQYQNRYNYGGTIDDEVVKSYLDHAKNAGLKIMFYPFLMIDTPGKPWRGHLTGPSSDIEKFYHEQYEPFILHYANLVKGKVDAFIIGSEMVSVTKIFTLDAEGNKIFPFVEKLILLAKKVKEILGKNVKISYAADWSEYHTADGCLRPMDALWASPDVDFVGIDAYFPLSDSTKSNISIEEIKKGWRSGQGIEYYYQDGKKIDYPKNERWNYWKDLEYWWNSDHWAWDNIKQESIKTPWVPRSKPIWFTEFGFPSVDKAPNQPNVFYDPRCTDGGVPRGSNGHQDREIQKRGIIASLEKWQNSFVENMFYWCYDSRGLGWQHDEYYSDGRLWQFGHWIDGKIGSGGMDLTWLHEINLESVTMSVTSINFKQIKIIKITNRFKLDTEKNLPLCGLTIDAGSINLSSSEGIAIENSTINSKSFIAKGKKIEVKGSHFKIIDHIKIIMSEGDINFDAYYTSSHVDSRWGEKTTYHDDYQDPVLSSAKTKDILLIAKNNIILKALYLEASRMQTQSTNLTFDVLVTTHKHIQIFKGDKSESTTVRLSQTAHQTYIKADVISSKIYELFTAVASKVIAIDCAFEANNYLFQGAVINSSEVFEGSQSKRFRSTTNTSSSSASSSVRGAEFIMQESCFIFAEDSIYMVGSSVDADYLTVVANNVTQLESMTTSQSSSLKVTKKGVRLTLTFGNGEASVGQEIYKKCIADSQMSEGMVPSGLIGRSNFLFQSRAIKLAGGFLAGGKAQIEADEWENQEQELYSFRKQMSYEISAGAKIGIRENVSGVGKSINKLNDAISESEDNEYASASIALSSYNTIRALANIASGNVISAGAMLYANADYQQSFESRRSYVPNYVNFESLEAKVRGEVSGVLAIEAEEKNIEAGHMDLRAASSDIYKRKGFSIGASIDSSGGIGARAGILDDDKSFGFSYGRNIFAESGQNFGISYSDNRGHFAGSFGTDDIEKISTAFSGGISGIADRISRNINTETAKLIGMIQSPSSIMEDLASQVQTMSLGHAQAAGDAQEDEKEEIAQQRFKKPVELLHGVNPNIKEGEKVEYCMVLLYDPGVNYNNTTQETSVSTVSIGHFYHGVGRIGEDGCVKEEIWGYNPKETNLPVSMPVYLGELKGEEKRYQYADVHEFRNNKTGEFIVQKAIPITEDQYSKYMSFISDTAKNPGMYIVGLNDCIENTKKALEVINLGDVKLQNIIKSEEIKVFFLAKASSYLRQVPLTILGTSREEIAARFNVSLERIREVVPFDDTDSWGVFEIKPLD